MSKHPSQPQTGVVDAGEPPEKGTPSAASLPTPAESDCAIREGTARLRRGQSLGRYWVLEVLGEGGMGVVYSGFDPELNRKVAIKLWQADRGKLGSAGQARLLREAQAMAQLSHPNAVAVYDVGSLPGGEVFVAMELVEGCTLRQWLAQQPRQPGQVLSLFLGAGAGLAAAHDVGLIHRDFKADNVLVGQDGRPRVCDFGLARARQEPAGPPPEPPAPTEKVILSTPLTDAGRLLGTPAYMAPELFHGAEATAASDQFSFAVAIYEALAGRRPFEEPGRPAGPGSEPWRVVEPLRIGSPRVRRALLKALSADPSQRFPSMRALLSELDPQHTLQRRRGLALAAGTLVVLGIGAGLALQLSAQRRQWCQGADQQLRGVWDLGQRQRLQAAFLASGAPDAPGVLARTLQALDAYARAWARMSTESCEATRIRGEQSDEVLSLRTACLANRRLELESLVSLLTESPGRAVVGNAPGAVYALTELGACSDVSSLRSPLRLPLSPEGKAELERERQQLARAKALGGAGRVPEAIALAQAVAEQAGRAQLRLGRAQALFLTGSLQSLALQREGTQSLLEAGADAQASGDDETAARAYTELLNLSANLDDFPAARNWRLLAAAAVDRLGKPPRLMAPLLIAQATLAERSGARGDSLRLRQQALAIQERLSSPDDPSLARAYAGVALSLLNAARLSESEAFQRKALAIRERVLGPDHPSTALSLMNLELALWGEGKSKEALAAAERSEQAFLRSAGPNSMAYRAACGHAGLYRALLGDPDGAVQVLRGCGEEDLGRVRASGQPMPVLADAWGEIRLRRGDPRTALRLFEDANAAYGVQTTGTSFYQTEAAGRGRALLALGRAREAVPILEKASADTLSLAPAQAGLIDFALLQALARTGAPTPRWKVLAQAAQVQLERAGLAEQARSVRAWLAHRQGS